MVACFAHFSRIKVKSSILPKHHNCSGAATLMDNVSPFLSGVCVTNSSTASSMEIMLSFPVSQDFSELAEGPHTKLVKPSSKGINSDGSVSGMRGSFLEDSFCFIVISEILKCIHWVTMSCIVGF